MKKGFTLIELLVVVLIIGILAAIAVPQYQKAVEKARLAEPLSIMGALQKAIDRYNMENDFAVAEFLGTEATNTLDIDLKLEASGTNSVSSNYFEYRADCGGDACGITADRKTGGYGLSFVIYYGGEGWQKEVWMYDDSFCSISKYLASQGWNGDPSCD